MLRLVSFASVVLLALLLLGGPLNQPARAQASGQQAMHEEWMRGFQQGFADAQQILLEKDPSQWSKEEIEAYLFNALFSIYNANNIYIDRNFQNPYSANVLRNSGILSPWPGNPFRNWEPITWDEYPTEFSAGDIVLQLCPPAWYSGSRRQVPLTFVMSINGPSSDYQPVPSDDKYPIAQIYDWDIVLPGTAFMTTSYYEPATETLAKAEAAKLK
jgi:hypothetical protein